jgi:hypothetical protein
MKNNMNDSILIQKMNIKISELHASIDSIKQSSSINQLTYEMHQKQNLISQVNDFYDSAWLKLIIVISVLGILVPIIAQYFQRKNLKDLTEFIRKQMNDSFDLKIQELKIFNSQEIEKVLDKLNSNIKSIEDKNQNFFKELDASTLYLQGRASVLDKNYPLAIVSFLKSADFYLQTERPERAKVQFANLKLCIKAINDKILIAQASSILEKSTYKLTFDEMIEFFKTHPLKNIYEGQLSEIIKDLERIMNGI